jgi:hypothetical protein
VVCDSRARFFSSAQSKKLLCALVSVLVFISTAIAVERTPADLSGTWKLVREKSKGASLAKAATELDITQRGDEVKFDFFHNGEPSGSEAFLADNNERTRYTTRVDRAYARVHWDKDTLVIVTRHFLDALGYQTFSDTDSWALSHDQNTVINNVSDGSVLVYERDGSSESSSDVRLNSEVAFRAVGIISGRGPCHGTSFDGTLKGDTIGSGAVAFCGPVPTNWGHVGSCSTNSGTLTFTRKEDSATFQMNVVGQYCVTERGSSFRGNYEVDRSSIRGAFSGHLTGGSGEVEYSNVSNTISLQGVLY